MTDYDPRLSPLITWTTIGAGVTGTRETMRMMKTLSRKGSASAGIRRFADTYRGMTAEEALVRLDDDVRRVFRYRPEMDEIIRTPEFMISDLETYGYMEGDCDDIATFVASVCIALAIPARFVAIRTNPNGNDYRHVFTQGFAQGIGYSGWIRLDATVQRTTTLEYYGQAMIQTV